MSQQHPELVVVPNFDDFGTCWAWLDHHPYFFYIPADGLPARMARHVDNEPGFTEALDIFVGPDGSVSLECGPWIKSSNNKGPSRYTGDPCHDYELDVVASTFEDAIRALARKVFAQHGSYPHYEICSHCLRRLPAGNIDEDQDWFCSPVCEAHGKAELVTEPVPGANNVVRMVPWSTVFDCEHFPTYDDDPPRVSPAERVDAVRAVMKASNVSEEVAEAAVYALVALGWEPCE